MNECVDPAPSAQISFNQFLAVDIRIGRIVAAVPYPEARKPSYKLTIDFGPEIGFKRSSAQITYHYQCDELIQRLILAVVNFPPRQIGRFMSEVLVLGVPDQAGEVILIEPDKEARPGVRVF